MGIRVFRLRVKRGRFVLNVDGLSVNDGDKVAVLGENGSGKSTLLLALGGLVPFEGEILLDGMPINRMSLRERAKRISILVQDVGLSFNYTVFHVVLMGRFPWFFQGRPGEEDLKKTREVIEFWNLTGLSDRFYWSLSGGERRRVDVARVFNQDAPVQLFDEPTSFMDVATEKLFFERMRTSEKTVICALHDVNAAVFYFDRLIFLKNGRVVGDVSASEVDEGLLFSVYGVAACRRKLFCFY